MLLTYGYKCRREVHNGNNGKDEKVLVELKALLGLDDGLDIEELQSHACCQHWLPVSSYHLVNERGHLESKKTYTIPKTQHLVLRPVEPALYRLGGVPVDAPDHVPVVVEHL